MRFNLSWARPSGDVLVATENVFGATDICFDEPRDRVYVVCATGSLHVLDATTLGLIATYKVPFGSRYLYLHPQTDLLVVGNATLPSISILPLSSPQEGTVVTDVPIGVRGLAVVGCRLIYTNLCGIYGLDLRSIGRGNLLTCLDP